MGFLEMKSTAFFTSLFSFSLFSRVFVNLLTLVCNNIIITKVFFLSLVIITTHHRLGSGTMVEST